MGSTSPRFQYSRSSPASRATLSTSSQCLTLATCQRLVCCQTVRTRGVMIPALDPDPESDFQFFYDSRSGSSKQWNHNTSHGQTSSFQSTRVAYSDHSSNPVCGFGSSNPVLLRPNSTESNLFYHGETTYRVG